MIQNYRSTYLFNRVLPQAMIRYLPITEMEIQQQNMVKRDLRQRLIFDIITYLINSSMKQEKTGIGEIFINPKKHMLTLDI